jgi:hypothetical protein
MRDAMYKALVDIVVLGGSNRLYPAPKKLEEPRPGGYRVISVEGLLVFTRERNDVETSLPSSSGASATTWRSDLSRSRRAFSSDLFAEKFIQALLVLEGASKLRFELSKGLLLPLGIFKLLLGTPVQMPQDVFDALHCADRIFRVELHSIIECAFDEDIGFVVLAKRMPATDDIEALIVGTDLRALIIGP